MTHDYKPYPASITVDAEAAMHAHRVKDERIRELEAENKHLRAALEDYGEHRVRCESRTPVPGGPCTCGFNAVLAGEGK